MCIGWCTNQVKEGYLCTNQSTVAVLQQIAKYISSLWHKPISRYCIGDTLNDKNKSKNLANAKIYIYIYKKLDLILRCIRVTIGPVEEQ